MKKLVVLPIALVAACAGVTEQTDPDAAPAADAASEASAGGSSGSPPQDAAMDLASGGSGEKDTGVDQQQDCGPWGSSGADPAPAPLNCNAWEHGELLSVGGAVDNGVLQVRIVFYGGFGTWSELNAVVSPELGTLESLVPPTGGGEIHPAVVVNITLAPEASEGTVTFSGVIQGQDQCHVTVACPVERVLKVKLPDGGAPQVARAPGQQLGAREKVVRQLDAMLGNSRRNAT